MTASTFLRHLPTKSSAFAFILLGLICVKSRESAADSSSIWIEGENTASVEPATIKAHDRPWPPECSFGWKIGCS